MKKVFKVLLPLTLWGMFAGCGDQTSSVSQSSPSISVSESSLSSSQSFPSNQDIVRLVISKISSNPLALRGNYTEGIFFGEDSELRETSNYDYISVLEDDYFFSETTSIYYEGEVLYERIDKDEYGYAKIGSLNPLSNEVDDYYLGDIYNENYPFDAVFVNPFARREGNFMALNGHLKLTSLDDFDFSALNNILTGGSGFRSVTTLQACEIGYDEDYHPTTFELVMSDDTWIEYGQSTIYTYSGEFIDPETVDVVPYPEPRQAQPGQEKLAAMFDRLKEENYTMHCYSESFYEEEDWEDDFSLLARSEEREPSNIRETKMYITKDGYYSDYITENGYNQYDEGMYLSENGLVEYVDIDGTITETKLPYTARNIDYYFGDCWSYSSQMFDVNADGSFTLATTALDDLYAYLWTYLLPDPYAYSVGIVDSGTLTFVIDETNDTFSYTYTCFGGAEEYQTTISDIGTTVLPFSTDNVEKYVPYANWTEFVSSSSWNEEFGNMLDILTNGHMDDIPYIESPYNYLRSYSTIDDTVYAPGFDPDDEEAWDNWDWSQGFPYETVTVGVSYIDMTWECDTVRDIADYTNSIIAQIEALPYYTYDRNSDSYIYERDGVKFSLHLSVETNFSAFEETFKYGVRMYLKNLTETE